MRGDAEPVSRGGGWAAGIKNLRQGEVSVAPGWGVGWVGEAHSRGLGVVAEGGVLQKRVGGHRGGMGLMEEVWGGGSQQWDEHHGRGRGVTVGG